MSGSLLLIIVIILLFGFVVFFGAPYLPTLNKQVSLALDLLELKEEDTLLELGSGDGKVMLEAAKRGVKVTGFELNPLLVIISKFRLRNYKNTRVIWGNYWKERWPETDGIFVFLLPKYMERLDKSIVQKYRGKNVKLVSFAFQITGKKAEKEKDGLYVYYYK